MKTLILIGGGHTHVLVMNLWAQNPLPNVELVLVSPSPQTPYSGMLPGLVAGHYNYSEVHIDLAVLAEQTGVRFIEAEVVGLDLPAKLVKLATGEPLPADVVSIDIGSTPTLDVQGAAEHAIAVKPISHFYQAWRALNERGGLGQKPASVAVVGAGAAGVELVLAMDHYWQSQGWRSPPSLHLVQTQTGLPQGYRPAVQRAMARECKRRGITVHESFKVEAVEAERLRSCDGRSLSYDRLFWCTQASAAAWPGQSGLAVDERGFIAIADSLQSTSHPWVFAAGDTATQVANPRPKAGVYAVRQAPVLHHNLRAALSGEPLRTHCPQSDFLSLLALGDKRAVATKWGFTLSGTWVWRWKDRIDRRFMNQFPAYHP